MNNRDRAQQIYDSNEKTRETYNRMGMQLTGILAATVDDIETHLNLVDEVSSEYSITLYADKFEIGISREQIAAAAEAKIKANKRSAGARALSRKYGKQAAERIIEKHTGKHVTLKN